MDVVEVVELEFEKFINNDYVLRTCAYNVVASLFPFFHLSFASFILNMPFPYVVSMLTMLHLPCYIHMFLIYIN